MNIIRPIDAIIVLNNIVNILGEYYAESIAMIAAKLILHIVPIITPILWCIEKTKQAIPGKSVKRFTTNEVELKLLASIRVLESNLINHVFELNNTTAKMIMTPRVSVICLSGFLTFKINWWIPNIVD